jgi:hypothetical protein
VQFALSIALFTAVSLVVPSHAQEHKIEISPFAGGYINSGYQTTGRIDVVGRTASSGEPNTGIFGVRGSHVLTSTLVLEGTFGFSPTGRRRSFPTGAGFIFTDVENFLTSTDSFRSNGDTYHYAANVLPNLYDKEGWVPFFTAGAGAVRRAGKEPTLGIVTLPPGSITVVPEETGSQSILSVNIGGGVKKYLADRYGIRFDFRSYINQPDGDTVNNMEFSFGLIFGL